MAPSRQRREQPARHAVAEHVRERQRAVAEREASRLARPEIQAERTLGHADRTKSAVTSTPFGVLTKNKKQSTASVDTAWCGPFSVARQMIAQRDDAKRQRLLEQEHEPPSHPLDAMMEEIQDEQRKQQHPSFSWKGTVTLSSGSTQRRRQTSRVPTLLELCIDFVVHHFEHVESLGHVDASIRTQIATALIARGKLNNDAVKVLTHDTAHVETLELQDCSLITHDCLKHVLQHAAALRYLKLNQCGRCFGTTAVQALQKKQALPLLALSIGGAYLLQDQAAATLVQAISTTITTLEFKACPLLGIQFCQALSHIKKNQLLELTLHDIPLTTEQLQVVVRAESLHSIRHLSLQRLTALNDDLIEQWLTQTGPTCEELDLTENYHLTDQTLAAIRLHCTAVHSLTLSGLRLLTAEGLEALFTVVEAAEPPPMLRKLILNQCDYQAVTDQVILLAAQASTRHGAALQRHYHHQSPVVGSQSVLSMGGGGLKHLDIQGSTVVSDAGLEELVQYCASTLEELNVSFCPLLTSKGLGYWVDHTGPQLCRLEVWGMAQLDKEFWNGHCRAQDPTLEITGAWVRR